VHLGHAHGDDLAFEAHLHPVKRQVVGPGFLVLELCQARIAAQIRQHGAHAGFGPGDGAVDAFGGQQQRALDVVGLALREQRRLQRGKVGQLNKLVEGGGRNWGMTRGQQKRWSR
jgi:hypothetical protein